MIKFSFNKKNTNDLYKLKIKNKINNSIQFKDNNLIKVKVNKKKKIINVKKNYKINQIKYSNELKNISNKLNNSHNRINKLFYKLKQNNFKTRKLKNNSLFKNKLPYNKNELYNKIKLNKLIKPVYYEKKKLNIKSYLII